MNALRGLAGALTVGASLLSASVHAQEKIPAPSSRPFHLGFTPWPSDTTLEGLQTASDFARAHGDIVSFMLMGGIPWPEALAGTPYSKDVESTLRYRPPAGTKLFLSISPLSMDRKSIAPYWGAKDNLPLPPPWDSYALNNLQVKRAYRNFALHAVESLHPDYLALGIELNVLLSYSPEKWKQMKELYRETRAAVKAKYPALPVCFTTEVLHYRKIQPESRDKDQAGEVADLMRDSDLFALSFYPYMSYDVPRPLPADFLDFATAMHKPIAISESGMISRNEELKSYKLTLFGSEADQQRFETLLLGWASRDKYVFVINFATTDFEKLCDRLPPPTDDLARIWEFSGLQTSDKKPKPALAVWDAYLKAPYRPGR